MKSLILYIFIFNILDSTLFISIHWCKQVLCKSFIWTRILLSWSPLCIWFILFIPSTSEIYRPGVSGAVLQTPPLLIDSWIKWKYLKNSVYPNLLELGSWNFETMFTTACVSHVTCQVSHVTFHQSYAMCHMSRVIFHISHKKNIEIYKKKILGASRWSVLNQPGLYRLVSTKDEQY